MKQTRQSLILLTMVLLASSSCVNKQAQQRKETEKTNTTKTVVAYTPKDTVLTTDTVRLLPPDTNAIYRDTVVCDSITTIGMMEWGGYKEQGNHLSEQETTKETLCCHQGRLCPESGLTI